MTLDLNEVLKGFKLLKKYRIDEIDSDVMLFEHVKTGAQLMNVANNDDNKVFTITFRTPPSDNTGVPHIVEHCVLSGSRKYWTKEPFMDMVKGSMSTFINAMTFSDKTMYPIASKNEKDFYNLMDVYLDAVFFPKIYEKEDIFMQEGWHYDIQSPEEDIIYKGIVYNEMKGAYSDPTEGLKDSISRSLYKDTCYSYSSGGDPDYITDLTYEGFLDFHKKYYHPSNSYIYLYGDGNLEKSLEYIDSNYLSLFDKLEIDSTITKQEIIDSGTTCHTTYPIGDDEDTLNKDYISISFCLGETSDPKVNLMSDIIEKLLVDSSASPLKKALLDAEIAEEILSLSSDGLYKTLSIALKNTDLSRKDEFISIVFDTISAMVSEGIERNLIESSINVVEYDLREASRFPTKGIIYHITSTESWLYDCDESIHLKYNTTLSDIRNSIDANYFENFLKETILENPHYSICTMSPEKGVFEKKTIRDKEMLANYKQSLSNEELEQLVTKNNKLKEKQLSPDTAEDLATIPKLSISDITKESEKYNTSLAYDGKYKVLYNDIFTNSISYLDMIFDLKHINSEEMLYVALLCDLMGEMSTENYTYDQLSNAVLLSTGGIDYNPKVYTKYKTHNEIYPKLVVSTKAIGNKLLNALALIKEISLRSNFSDTKRVKDLINQVKSKLDSDLTYEGNAVVASRLSSYFSAAFDLEEKINGLDYFWFITDLANNYEDKKDELTTKLYAVYNKMFLANNLIISFTGQKEEFDLLMANAEEFVKELDNTEYEAQNYEIEAKNTNEGIMSSSNVQYVGIGYNFNKLGYDYHGSMYVMSTILNSEFLHDHVRAKGGAYGCRMNIDSTGKITIASYRDPNLKETYNVYNMIPKFLNNFDLTDDEAAKFIVGAIGKIDGAKTPHTIGIICYTDFITGRTYEDRHKIRKEILGTTSADIRKFGPMIKDVIDKNYICTLGNEKVIQENKDIFNTLVKFNN